LLLLFSEPSTEIIGAPDLYIESGSTINLTCVVHNSPEPPAFIFWNHNNAVSFSFELDYKISLRMDMLEIFLDFMSHRQHLLSSLSFSDASKLNFYDLSCPLHRRMKKKCAPCAFNI
jgi:hypothetical protein